MLSLLNKKYPPVGFNLLQQDNFRKYLFSSQMKSIDNIVERKKKNFNKNLYYRVFNESTTLNRTNFDATFLFLAMASSIGFFFLYRYNN
jgi:hypothetical protein